MRPAVGGDSIIPTAAGPVSAHELIRGALVAVGKGNHALVVQAEASGVKASHTSYRIVTRHRDLSVNATQNLLVVEREELHAARRERKKYIGKLGWRLGREMRPGMIVVCADSYYPAATTIGTDLARFVGAYLGDGWIRMGLVNPNGYALGLAIGSEQDSHTGAYLDLCQRIFPHTAWKNNAKGAFGISATSTYVTEAIRGLGLDKPSTARRVPAFAFTLARVEKIALISGYIDADATVGASGGAVFGSRSPELIADLRELAIGCGLDVGLIGSQWVENTWGSGYFYRAHLAPSSTAQVEIWHDKKRENVKTSSFRKSGRGLSAQYLSHLELPTGYFSERVRKVERQTNRGATIRIETNHSEGRFIASGLVVASDPTASGLVYGYRRIKGTVGKFIKKADRPGAKGISEGR